MGSGQDQHGNPRPIFPLLPLVPPLSLVSTTRLAHSTSEPKPLATPAGVCGGPIAALLGSDLPTLRNPAPAFGVIAATESEFDPLHPPDQPASASATPRHGRSCFAADRPLVALHQDQERLRTKAGPPPRKGSSGSPSISAFACSPHKPILSSPLWRVPALFRRHGSTGCRDHHLHV